MRYSYDGGYAEISLASATRDELLEAQDRIGDFRGLIQAKIDKANADRSAGLGYADPHDYVRWKDIARRLGGQMRKLNRALARKGAKRKKKNQEQSRAENAIYERCFIEAARAILHPDDYAAVIQAAVAMKESREEQLEDES